MSKYSRLVANLEKAYRLGREAAERGDERVSYYRLCELGNLLDGAWYGGYDDGVDSLRRTAAAMAKVVDRCPWDPPKVGP